MQFGVCVATKIDDWQLIQYAEELGYDRAWIPDSQMIWSDCYATLALAAQHTSRIQIGTGVAIPGTRIAPVTAHSIASINRMAPGRVFLGIGTGHTAMRVMGMQPMRIRDFREYLRVVKTLLRGEEVAYTYNDTMRTIRFLHQDLHFLNLDDPIPMIVAANGPRALKAAGEFGDGWVAGIKPGPEAFLGNWQQVPRRGGTGRSNLARQLPYRGLYHGRRSCNPESRQPRTGSLRCAVLRSPPSFTLCTKSINKNRPGGSHPRRL